MIFIALIGTFYKVLAISAIVSSVFIPAILFEFYEDDLSFLNTPPINQLVDSKDINPNKKNEYVSDFDLMAGTQVRIPSQFSSLKQEFENTISREKSRILINENRLSAETKKKIPYSVTEEEIKAIIENIPTNQDNITFWIKTKKNNSTGEIAIQVLASVWYYDAQIFNSWKHTELLTEKTIAGFATFNDEEIIKERSLRVLIHNYNWIRHGEKPKDFNYPNHIYKSYGAFGFKPKGSAFVIDKEENKPIYYIATNKHVVDSVIEGIIETNVKDYKYHNFVEIGITNKEERIFINPLEKLSENEETKNLQGFINFQDHKGDYLQNKNIKSIELVKDFSYPHSKPIVMNGEPSQHYSINKNLSSLVTKTNGEFVTVDLIVFKVEFNSNDVDPFKKMWNKRPTKVATLKEEDFLYSNTEVFHTKSAGITDNIHAIGSFYVDTWSCKENKQKEMRKNIKITSGKSTIDPYWHRNQVNGEYTKNSYVGVIKFTEAENLHVFGSSGSAVFDQNLNVSGILWAGSIEKNKDICDVKNNKFVNYFSWLKTKFDGDKFKFQTTSQKDKKIYENSPNYDYFSLLKT